MKKKIRPAEQTKKLSEAYWEFLQRNPEVKGERAWGRRKKPGPYERYTKIIKHM